MSNHVAYTSYHNYCKCSYTRSIRTPLSNKKNNFHFHPNHSYSQMRMSDRLVDEG